MASTRDLILKFQADTTELKQAAGQAQRTTAGMADGMGDSSKKGASKFKSGMGSMLGVLKKVAGPIAAIFAIDRIKDFAIASVNAASDLNETISKSGEIFGKQAGAMKQWAEGGAQAFGLSTEAALGAAASFGDMFSQIGFTGKEAAKQSQNVVQMAADLGSFNNLDTNEVLDMISASLRGEYDSLQRVIPNINAARVQQEAMAATGKKNASSLTAQEKAQATLAIIQKDGARASGDFARTSGGLANQQKILAANFENLKASLGQAALPLLEKGAKLLNSVLGPAAEAVTKGVQRMGDAFKNFRKGGADLGPVGAGLSKLSEAAKRLWSAISPIVTAIGGKLFETIKKNLPKLQAMFAELSAAIGPFLSMIGSYYSKVAAVIKKVWTVIGPTVLRILGNVINAIVSILGGLIKIISGIMTVLVGIFTGDGEKIKKGLTKIFSGLVKIVGALVKLMVNNVRAVLDPLIGWVVKRITAMKNGVVSIFTKITKWIATTWAKAWGAVKGFFTRPVLAAAATLAKLIDRVKTGLRVIQRWMASTWKSGWAKIKGYFSAPVTAAQKLVAKWIGKIRDKLASVRTWASTTWKNGWAKLRSWITAPISKGRADAGAALDKVKARLRGIRDWASNKWSASWSKLQGWIMKPINAAKKSIVGIFGYGGSLRGVLNRFITAVGTIFGKLKRAVGKPINGMIKFINEGLLRGGINKILGALGVPKGEQIPWLKPLSLAAGGPVTGGRPWQRAGRDRYPAYLDHDEHVLSRAEVRKLGGHRRILQWRKAVAQGKAYDYPGLAGGGTVRPVPGGFGTFPSYPGHTGVDFPVGMNTPVHAVSAGVIKAVRSLTYSYGKHIIQSMAGSGMESLYAHLNSFKVRQGQSVGAGQVIGYSDSTGNSTGPHLHYTLQHPGGNYVNPTGFLQSGKVPGGDSGGGITGAITDFVGFLKGLSPVKWLTNKAAGLKDQILGFLGRNPWARGLARVPGLLISKAKDYMQDKLFSGLGFGEPAGSGSARWRSTIVQALRMNNLPTTDAYVDAWLRQVQSESGGNPKAVQNGYVDVNTISGDLAKGLLQTISATFNAYSFPGHKDIFNGFHNALAAINYAKNRYGSRGMLGVIGHGHGYDSGGMLPRGYSVAYNGTNRPEPVLTGQQWDALLGAGGQGAQTVIQIHVDGTLNDDRTIGKLLTEIDRYQRRRGPVQLTGSRSS